MCGGIKFSFDIVDEEELERFLAPAEFDLYKKSGIVQTVYWSKRPFLPAVDANGEVHVYDWGNREKGVSLPKTGWARFESLVKGAWNYLNPVHVVIPATEGCEKKVWFKVRSGIRGLLVEKDGQKRIYMVTEPANKEYLKMSGHDRMPKYVDSI